MLLCLLFINSRAVCVCAIFALIDRLINSGLKIERSVEFDFHIESGNRRFIIQTNNVNI